VFYSFIALFIATAIGAVYIDILHIDSPFSFGHGTPVKVFGNIGAIALFIGVLLMIINRFANAAKIGMGSYFDFYFIHLVFVFSLFLYVPYSKLAHLFYRGAAICFEKYSRRDVVQSTNPETVSQTEQQKNQ
jgi:quinone-modifying oxidoreductase subunit QmoC